MTSDVRAYLLNRIGQVAVQGETAVVQLLELLAQKDAEISALKAALADKEPVDAGE